MKILHYVESKNLSFRVPWIDLIKELARRGLEQRLLCRGGGNLEEAARENGVDVVTWRPVLTNFPPINVQYPMILKSFAPDIVHTRLSSAANIAGFWDRLLGVPTIAMLDGAYKWKYYNKADHFTASSAWAKKKMMGYSVPDDKIDVVYNAIDAAKFHRDDVARSAFRERLGISEDEIVFIGVGSFSDGKGFDILVRAFADLARSLADIKLLLVGDGPEKETLVQIANEASVSERVIFSDGYQKDVRPWLSAGDCFILPSRIESFGIVILEAMASALPVVVTQSGGPEEIVTNGVDGLVVASGDIGGLSAAMRKMLTMDTEIRQNMQKKAKQRLNRFTCKTVASHLIQIYNKVLAR